MGLNQKFSLFFNLCYSLIIRNLSYRKGGKQRILFGEVPLS
jgi:hypothetical protein